MNLKNISLKWQILVLVVLLIIVPTLVVGMIGYNTANQEMVNSVEGDLTQKSLLVRDHVETAYNLQKSKVTDALNLFIEEITVSGLDFASGTETLVIEGSGERIDFTPLELKGQDLLLSDYIYGQAESLSSDTLFYFRITDNGLLNIPLTNQETAFLIPDNEQEYTSLTSNGFYGVINLNNTDYILGCAVLEAENKDEAVLCEGTEKAALAKPIKEQLSDFVIGETGYIALLNSEGDYVLSKNMEQDGKNIWGATDDDGELFVQQVINDSLTFSSSDDSGIVYYSWKNPGELFARQKVGAYTYFEQLDWVIWPNAYHSEFLSGMNRIRAVTVLVIVLSVLIAGGLAYLFVSRFTSPFKKIIDSMKQVADGDLTQKSALNGNKEFEMLSDSFNKMVDNLKSLIKKLQETVSVTASSSQQLSASSEQVNTATNQVSTTIQELAKGSETLSKSSEDAKHASQETAANAEQGKASASQITDRMNSISQITTESAQQINALGEKSDQISEIVSTIEDVSKQTNLLALNAAIEAARAGDAGRGFAVVADQVRKLAEETQEATGKISTLITGIQGQIHDSVDSMDKNSKEVAESTDKVQQAISLFEQIPELINKANGALNDMASVAEENAAGTEEVSASIEEVSSSMNQVSSTAQQLTSQAENLKDLANKFKV
ncbi:MAG: methyl-accepting chemotaxis protein [Nanobdellota archaeon]